jgi:signal peptidase II
MQRIHRLGLVILILIACTSCDQMTKSIAKVSLAPSSPISLLNDSIRLEYIENPGAILGLGGGLPREARVLFAIIFVSVVLAFTLVFALDPRRFSLMQLVGMSLVAAGGLGNLLDRLANDGSVIDFIRLRIGPLQTGIFNIADVAIMGGAFTLLLSATEKTSANTPEPD